MEICFTKSFDESFKSELPIVKHLPVDSFRNSFYPLGHRSIHTARKNLDKSRRMIKAVGNYSTCFNITVHCNKPRNSLHICYPSPRKATPRGAVLPTKKHMSDTGLIRALPLTRQLSLAKLYETF